MAQHALLVAVDCTPLGTVSVNHQPRSPAQWRGGSLSGCGVRSGRVGSGAAPQAVQAGLPYVLRAYSINLHAAAMVTGADCRSRWASRIPRATRKRLSSLLTPR